MNKPLNLSRGGISVQFETEQPSSFRNAFLPSIALLPFLQHKGSEAICMVTKGDYVEEGQVIAKTKDGSMTIHASVPGKLTDIKTVPLPDGSVGPAAVLDMSGSFSFLGKRQYRDDWSRLEKRVIDLRLQNSVIVNTADVPTPLNTQIQILKNKADVCLVIRFFEKDPSYILDSFLVKNFAQEIIQGMAILAKATRATSLILVGSQDRVLYSVDDFIAMCSQYLPETLSVKYFNCKERYPIGKTEELLSSLLPRLPIQDPGAVLVVDSSTAKAIYDCVETNHPVLDKFIYVGGAGLRHPSMLKVRIGTKIGDLIEECGGFTGEPSRIIVNGLFSGNAIYDLDTPVTKSTLSILVLSRSDFSEYFIANCIHCGACIQVCPVGINPIKIYNFLKSKKYEEALKVQADLCHGCGCCGCVCPSRVPLLQLFSQNNLGLKKKI